MLSVIFHQPAVSNQYISFLATNVESVAVLTVNSTGLKFCIVLLLKKAYSFDDLINCMQICAGCRAIGFAFIEKCSCT